jgi:hypothetical protein
MQYHHLEYLINLKGERVIGDEPCVMLDFTGAKDYAKESAHFLISIRAK